MRIPILLLVASDQALRRVSQDVARKGHFQVLESPGKSTLSQFFENKHPELVVIGPAVQHPWDALHIARLVRQWTRRVPIIVVATHGSEELAVASMRAGVSDYFRTPVDVGEFAEGVRRLVDDSTPCDVDVASPGHTAARATQPLIGEGGDADGLRTSIQNIAATDSNVLITGETGTGKELTAKLIHLAGDRSNHAFVSINCAAIPDSLFESELFGYERGAFTGATSSNAGRVSAAHGGTAFFDEIGDMSPLAQAKVLRVVEDKEVTRLGSTRSIRVNARIVTATNQNLETLVAEGRFRSDLYFRLNVARIHLAPLRERKHDIPLLLAYYLGVIRRRLHRDVEGFTDEALGALTAYHWPGNVRELKNVVERVVMNAWSRQITFADLPDELRSRVDVDDRPLAGERARLLAALSSANWNKSQAARALRCSRMTLYRKMAKCNVQPEEPSAMPRRRA